MGPGPYKYVMADIDSKNLLRPTTAQTFSLLDLIIQNKGQEHYDKVLKAFRKRGLWTCTETPSFPDGVIVYDNVRGEITPNSNDLMQRVKAGDEALRFLPKGFMYINGTKEFLPEFLESPYLIAQVGEGMDETVERVVKAFNTCDEPHVVFFASDKAISDTRRYTKLSGYSGECLCFNGDHDGTLYGFASGVLE